MRKIVFFVPVGVIAVGTMMLGGCGTKGTVSTGPTTAIPYTLTVSSANPTSGVSIGVAPADNNGAAAGSTSFTRTYGSGISVALTAPSTSGGNNFSSWTGCNSTSTTVCTVILSGNATVTANYVTPLVTPTVVVSPVSSSVTSVQSLQVGVVVSSTSGTPTGTVTLTSGGYSSGAIALTSGAASIVIPAGSLALGNDSLLAIYTPDTAGATKYNSASGTGAVTVNALLTVNSVLPASGVAIGVSPIDLNSAGAGSTSFTRTYSGGTAVMLTAPTTAGGNNFGSWSGCTTSSTTTCNVTMGASATVTATYVVPPTITSVTVTPNVATIGTTQQFTATVVGTGAYSSAVTWALSCTSCGTLSMGTLSSTGLYITPYPAPATVTITATSVEDTTKSGVATVTLSPPATATGPGLSVNAASKTHAINPQIYGVNGYALDAGSAATIHPGLIRWGGDDTSRYNYLNNWTNDGNDAFFENTSGAQQRFPISSSGTTFNQFVTATTALSSVAVGTMPLIGEVSNGAYACSYPQTTYPNQASYNSYHNGAIECGVGYYPNGTNGCTNASGCNITGVSASVTSTVEPVPDITAGTTPAAGSANLPTWAAGTWPGGWVTSIKNTYGSANNGGSVAIWDLDNEPTWWSNVHRDVHPNSFTYDEVTNEGLGTALAIKTVDPTALVSGPVIDNWWTYFYSETDVNNGYATGPCYSPWSKPTDRAAHGGVPMIEYYLQKFNSYSQTYGVRLLDYLDIHGYFAPKYNGSSVGLTTSGDTAEQVLRLNGTRVFWDPTYTDSNYPQPNYTTDANYTTSCTPPAQAPQLIPMLQGWVTKDYPGTKVSIDEYNFGGLESVNGAVAQADILGIFGRQGLDMAAFWPAQSYSTQVPGNMAFAMYRNYDGAKSTFGDTALTSTSTTATNADGEGQLAVYGALRSSDSAVTVMVVNKTYGALTSTLSLANILVSTTSAKVYQYSNVNLTAIVALPAATVTPPTGSGTISTVTMTFPAQSVTLLVVPN